MCGSAPSAPTLPQYPNLTPEQQSILGQWQSSINQQGAINQGVAGQLQGNQAVLQQLSGLINPDGSINQNALATLQQQSQQSLQSQGQAGNAALAYLNNLYGTGGAVQAQTQAYQDALAGNVPANKQMEFQQTQSWNQLKEQAAQRGIQIQGDNWNSATSNSTAGQKLIQNFAQNAGIQNQNYQLGFLNTAGQNLAALSGVGAQTASTGMGLSQNPMATQTGLLGQSISQGMGALTPYLQNYQTGLSNIYQPYYMQQIGPYQQQMAQAQANYQAQLQQYQANQGMLGGIGSLAGMGIGALAGGPLGAMIGGQIGGMAGGGTSSSGSMGVLPYMMMQRWSRANTGGSGTAVPASNDASLGGVLS